MRVRRRDAPTSHQGHSQVKFKVSVGTVSLPMLVDHGNRLVYRGGDTMLSMAAGEVAPVTLALETNGT